MGLIAHAKTGGALGASAVNRLLRLFNAGYGVDRIAAVLETTEDEVRAHLEANPLRRGRSLREARRVTHYPIAREDLPAQRDPRFGAGDPTFANDAGHVARVMAAGWFASLTEYEEEDGVRLGLPLRRPFYEGVEG